MGEACGYGSALAAELRVRAKCVAWHGSGRGGNRGIDADRRRVGAPGSQRACGYGRVWQPSDEFAPIMIYGRDEASQQRRIGAEYESGAAMIAARLRV